MDDEYRVPTSGEGGMNALHHAAYLNDPESVSDALRCGISVDSRDDSGWTPLHWAIDMSQAWGEPERVVSQLLQAGASANAIDRSGFSVLMMACGRNNEKILKLLLDAGSDIQVRSRESTPLHEAAGCNFYEAIEKLLLLGADHTQLNIAGLTPEQLAVSCGFKKSARILKKAIKPT